MTDESGTPPRARRKAVRRAGPPEGESPSATPAVPVPPDEPKDPVALTKPVPLEKREPAPITGDTPPPGDEPPVESDPGESSPRPQWLVPTLASIAAAVLVVLAVGVGFLAITNNREADERDEATAVRDAYVEAAKTTVLNLTTIHAETAKADVDKVLDNASGEFLDDFEGRIEPFVSIVREAQVDTDGEILAAGVESESDGEAVILVASKAMVKNAGTVEAQPRNFRMRITITDVDGKLTTSKVEFVP